MTKIEIEASSGNIFADLGIPQPEEALIQADLALAIGHRIAQKGWTQKAAAEVLGVQQSDVSNIVRGRLKGFSIERLIKLLRLLGHGVSVTITDIQDSHALKWAISQTADEAQVAAFTTETSRLTQADACVEIAVPTVTAHLSRSPINILFQPIHAEPGFTWVKEG